MICQTCQTQLSGKQSKFCSVSCKQKFNNIKHQTYEKQQEKGKYRKIQLMESLGGKCSNCGYDKNYAALCFHHLNPSVKELKLTLREISNNNFEKLKSEVEKCILLCHNCHMEEHHPQFNKK
jgi:hypothetical protein